VAAPGSASPGADYLRCFLELARTRAALQSVQLGLLYNPRAMSPAPDGGDPVARLREQASQIFESYVLGVKRRFCDGGTGAMSPADLRECCSQLMSMASLAASLTPR
jgi:hypothetical protein